MGWDSVTPKSAAAGSDKVMTRFGSAGQGDGAGQDTLAGRVEDGVHRAQVRRLAGTCGQGPASTVTKSRIQPLRYWSAGRYWSGTAARSGPPGDCAVSA